ncbi:S8 family peptidase [Curtobacterium flaccumfaciens]|uniref:S8 family peptidase n=1 Tax=Curtobacterium flaccumfaciens TaxID=2035 RepID=UPI0026598E73|nr:S8 family peptidase [Curtobacterium flaccumfaciens]MCS5517826.1 S8 family peptidase [Curtobacterium flaccumfaciens]
MAEDRVEFPLLVTRAAAHDERRSSLGSARPPKLTVPSRTRQAERLGDRFELLAAAMEDNSVTFAPYSNGSDPRAIIAFEVAGAVADFATAIRNVPGLEFIADADEEGTGADDDFRLDTEDATVPQTLYVVGNNRRAAQQIRDLWTAWAAGDDAPFTRGLGAWKRVFAQLRDVRPWGPQDRIDREVLANAWLLDHASDGPVRAEVNLWSSRNPFEQRNRVDAFETALIAAGGRVLDRASLSEIGLETILAEVPVVVARDTLAFRGVLATDPRVASVAPQSPASTPATARTAVIDSAAPAAPAATGNPIVAVLDGPADTTHRFLKGRVESTGPGTGGDEERAHGTAMVSLTVWGDLDVTDRPLQRPVLIDPVLETVIDANGHETAGIPVDRLAIQVIREALDRILERNASTEGAGVRVIVLALGQQAIPFRGAISPFARLVDHYAAKYDLLFVVSAGNHYALLEFESAAEHIEDPAELRAIGLRLLRDRSDRPLLAPAEAMNALTVGALHADATRADPRWDGMVDPLPDGSAFPSPVSGSGPGFNNGIKPDLMAPGGRVLFRHEFDRADTYALRPVGIRESLPGVLAAAFGNDGDSADLQRLTGTSAATGIVAHDAARIAESLTSVTPSAVPVDYVAVSVRALLVNTTGWSAAAAPIRAIWADDGHEGEAYRRAASKLLGYGALRSERVAQGAPHRITVLTTGMIWEGESREMLVPVPDALSGAKVFREVSATLAWFTRNNPSSRRYRGTQLWFELQNAAAFGVTRTHAPWRAARRGSLQHEIFAGSSAKTFPRDSALRFKINCAEDALENHLQAKFALAVTFEVDEHAGIAVYDYIAERMRQQVPIREHVVVPVR